MAATRSYMSCERIVESSKLLEGASPQNLEISRMLIDGVIEAPMGAHFTECAPDYGRDETFQKKYAATAKDPKAWETFRAEHLDVEDQRRPRRDRKRGCVPRTADASGCIAN